VKSRFSNRSMFSLLAKMRRGGPMRDKRSKRAEENKHINYLEEDEETFDLFDNAKKIAQERKDKDSVQKELSKKEIFLMKKIVLDELNKLEQKPSIRGKLNVTQSEDDYESITLWAGNNYKIVSFSLTIQRGVYGDDIKPHVYGYLYELVNNDEFTNCTSCAYSVKDMPKLLKEVAHHLSKWI